MQRMNFFSRLLDFLFPPRSHEEILRSLTKEKLDGLLSPTLIETTRPATTGLLPFRDPRVRALIHELKYHGSERAEDFLGAVLSEYIAEIGTDSFGKTVLIPLPLSPARARERGFNQCERIARRALLDSGNPLLAISTDILVRVKNTEHQARLSRKERLQNVAGAFSSTPCDPTVSYVILDDVITTGATMQAAIDALQGAGARHITPLTLSR